MHITIKYFGQIAEVTKTEEESLEVISMLSEEGMDMMKKNNVFLYS